MIVRKNKEKFLCYMLFKSIIRYSYHNNSRFEVLLYQYSFFAISWKGRTWIILSLSNCRWSSYEQLHCTNRDFFPLMHRLRLQSTGISLPSRLWIRIRTTVENCPHFDSSTWMCVYHCTEYHYQNVALRYYMHSVLYRVIYPRK